MIRGPPTSTRTYTLFPFPPLCRSHSDDGCERRRSCRGGRRCPLDRRGGRRRSPGPEEGRREDLRQAPLRARARRCRPDLADVGGAAVVELHAVAGGVQRVRLLRRALARRSEEHTSELQSLMRISYAVFCLKKKKSTVDKP